ncbi:lipase family protein [Phenylobacterium montanum]|uniref:Alpha/beta hydrolase n=1 Tax=Phenylobacterium montanum TaxID=2823693 RepID=A0A975FVU5_9CAUL|nr:lipase family protein [Caulobacter sp. S6]QUD86398.1 alpha/beta hydrolase [Caulobacter sp. S6]
MAHKNLLICLTVVISVALTAGSAAAQDDGLPKSLAEAVKMEAADALPRTALYDAPKSLAASKPGALLKHEAFDGYDLPKGARAVRILYHSQNDRGRDVATSAVVLIPAGTAPAGGWPVIAWAHGTSGVARQCAPSLMKDLYYGEEGLMPMVRAGYAVVATDYHGLGTDGGHQYIDKPAQTNDVVFSIPAARKAVPELGARWVVDGHSQGGLAAWGVAELEARRHDAGYLGAVAVAPGVGLKSLSQHLADPGAASFYLDYFAYAIGHMSPGFKPSDMLTGQALARYHDVTTKGCWDYAYASYLGDTTPPKLKPGWDETPAAKRLFTTDAAGEAPLGGPLFVIAGEQDHSVPLFAVRETVAKACKAGATLNFRVYPGLDHDPTMDKSTPDQLAWIADRFAGKAAGNDCPAAAK